MTETWAPIAGFEDHYQVSNHGNVRSLDRTTVRSNGRVARLTGVPLRPGWTNRGHLQVKLQVNRVKKNRLIHQLVLEAFGPPKPTHPTQRIEVRHRDGNPANNHIDNLQWGTQSDNQRDAVGHGTNANTAKTHCPAGHEYTPENTKVKARKDTGRTYRVCRQCQAATQRRYWDRIQSKQQTPPQSLAARVPTKYGQPKAHP